MTHNLTKTETRALNIVLSDTRPVPLPLTNAERAVLRIGLRQAAGLVDGRQWRRDLRTFARGKLDALAPDDLFLIVAALQCIKPTWTLFRRLTVCQHTLLLGIAWRLTDIIVQRHPKLASVLDSGWSALA